MPRPLPDHTQLTRRDFCLSAALFATGGRPRILRGSALAAQVQAPSGGTATRPNVAVIDRDRILAAAQHALSLTPTPLTTMVCPRSSAAAADYYSEPEPGPDSPARPGAAPFLAHRDALFSVGLAVPALAAAFSLTADALYAEHAAAHLRAWFVDPSTRMNPAMNFAQATPSTTRPPSETAGDPSSSAASTGRYQGILEALPLVEIAIAIAFLTSLTDADRSALHAWFTSYYHWLNDSRLAALARDSKSHHGASWMLQASACAWLAAPTGDVGRNEDSALAGLRHRFKSDTLRAQISPDGFFPREIASPWPYRDSLFTLDMLAGVCQLLSTRLESIWDYQLEEGPGMRAAIAWHFPYINDRGKWPYRADIDHFQELPSRRPSLLLAARAYQRPEYAALWRTLKPDPPDLAVLRTVPIHQPLLWVRQPPSA